MLLLFLPLEDFSSALWIAFVWRPFPFSRYLLQTFFFSPFGISAKLDSAYRDFFCSSPRLATPRPVSFLTKPCVIFHFLSSPLPFFCFIFRRKNSHPPLLLPCARFCLFCIAPFRGPLSLQDVRLSSVRIKDVRNTSISAPKIREFNVPPPPFPQLMKAARLR